MTSADKIYHMEEIPKKETMTKVIDEESFTNCFKPVTFDQQLSTLSSLLRMDNEEVETNLLDTLGHALGIADGFPPECIATHVGYHEDADENLLTRQTVTNLGKVERGSEEAFESASTRARKLKSVDAGSQQSEASSKDSLRAASHASQQRSSASSNLEKVVRFHEIHIRDYERGLGDNPSCTAGPPVGIGWSYGKTRTVNIDTYEEARPHRRSQVKRALTREEREKLLLAWGVSFHDIVDSIRSNIRVRNQRRQTVNNLGKVGRLEEAFESGARKLKRAVLLRRRTGNKVKELREQSELAQQMLATLRITEERASNEIHHDSGRIEQEPEEDVSDFCRDSPVESKVWGVPSPVSIEDDGASFMEGLPIGNSTTASVSEMEKFYRELELEMFGEDPPPSMAGRTLEVPGIEMDGLTISGTSTTASVSEMEMFHRELELEMFGQDPPPSMIGRTLEVPGIEIPEADRVYSDIESVFPEPPSVYGPEDTVHDEDDELDETPAAEGFPINPSYTRIYPAQTLPVHDGYMSNGYSARVQSNGAYRSQHDQGRSMLGRSLESDTELTSLHRQYNQYHSQSVYHPQKASIPMNLHLVNDRLGSSLDNADVMRPHNMLFHVQPHIHNSSLPCPASITPQHSYTFGANDLPLMTERRRVLERHPVLPLRDEPQVRLCPPPTYLSPTHWMEDRDSPRVRHMHEPITITEEGS